MPVINRRRLSVLVVAFVFAVGAATLLWSVWGGRTDTPDTAPSNDAVALGRYFVPDIALDNVQWELFSTPEAPVGLDVPGPTDFVSLVVVGRAMDPTALRGLVPAEGKASAFATPNAQRCWLPEWARELIKYVAEEAALPVGARCRRQTVLGVVSGTRHDGFVCTENGNVMYLIALATPSG